MLRDAIFIHRSMFLPLNLTIFERRVNERTNEWARHGAVMPSRHKSSSGFKVTKVVHFRFVGFVISILFPHRNESGTWDQCDQIWPIFESFWWQISLQKQPKCVICFWAMWNTSIFTKKLPWLLFGQLFEEIWVLFLSAFVTLPETSSKHYLVR